MIIITAPASTTTTTKGNQDGNVADENMKSELFSVFSLFAISAHFSFRFILRLFSILVSNRYS